MDINHHISVVSQNPNPFNATITNSESIGYGNEGVSHIDMSLLLHPFLLYCDEKFSNRMSFRSLYYVVAAIMSAMYKKNRVILVANFII